MKCSFKKPDHFNLNIKCLFIHFDIYLGMVLCSHTHFFLSFDCSIFRCHYVSIYLVFKVFLCSPRINDALGQYYSECVEVLLMFTYCAWWRFCILYWHFMFLCFNFWVMFRSLPLAWGKAKTQNCVKTTNGNLDDFMHLICKSFTLSKRHQSLQTSCCRVWRVAESLWRIVWVRMAALEGMLVITTNSFVLSTQSSSLFLFPFIYLFLFPCVHSLLLLFLSSLPFWG